MTRTEAVALHRRDNPTAYAPLGEGGLIIAGRMWRDGKRSDEIADRLHRHESVVANQLDEIKASAREWALPVAEAAE
ncbi:hypothetical protein [Methylopila sp. 73B]|uniref:hypothetical protein n=1 Tax=Methylopila sp. 73B TaxID=1120792 RepID=UPI0003626103|nr:hypothetical protein [Methylopila sp. 73B]